MSEQEPTAKQRAAYAAGRSAFAGGFDLTVCPYELDDREGLAVLWARGYTHARLDAGAPFSAGAVPTGLARAGA